MCPLQGRMITIIGDYYRMYGPGLKTVISTLKTLRRGSQSHPGLKPYDSRMSEQLLDIEELDYDIVEFRVKTAKLP